MVVFWIIYGRKIKYTSAHITHTIWKPGTREWRLAAVGFFYKQNKKIKLASFFARACLFIFLLKKNGKKSWRAYDSTIKRIRLYIKQKIAVIFKSESSDN